jgi:hypothetical protein
LMVSGAIMGVAGRDTTQMPVRLSLIARFRQRAVAACALFLARPTDAA